MQYDKVLEVESIKLGVESEITKTSLCGSKPNPESQPGLHLGVKGVQAGTLNAVQ